jgi:hypothetical protein
MDVRSEFDKAARFSGYLGCLYGQEILYLLIESLGTTKSSMPAQYSRLW